MSAENGTVWILRTSQTGLSVRFGSNGNGGLRGALTVAIDKPNVTAG
jgi:hypothetical protein